MIKVVSNPQSLSAEKFATVKKDDYKMQFKVTPLYV